MNASAPTTTQPLAIWDANDRTGIFWQHQLATSEWAVEHLPNKAVDIHRVEFYLVDTPFAVIHEYANDLAGRRYLDPRTGKAAECEPRTIALDELPPTHLLRSA